jgi:multiple sugar transport system substrate-binding protein
MTFFTRRETLKIGAGMAAGNLLGSASTLAQVPMKDVKGPGYEPEKGASLRVLRPAKFVDGDERLFNENTRKFTDQTGVQVTVDYESWEDLRPKTAVAANIGSGPDVVFGWLDDAFQYPDKLLDVTDVAEYLGEKYGGWFEVPTLYGRLKNGRWIGMPFGGAGACMVYRKSWMNEAGFQDYPKNLDGMLKLSQAMSKNSHPSALCLGHGVGDGNVWHWILWAFGGAVVDADNKVVLDSPETVSALEYAKELYATFIPGTASWLDPSNNTAFLAGEIGNTPNGISIYYVAKNSQDPNIQALAGDIGHASLPIGPVGRPTDTSTVITTLIFQHTKYPNAAKAYLTFLFEAPQYGAWQEATIGYWAPSLRAYNGLPFWTQDPRVTPFRDITDRMLWYGYRGEPGRASAAVLADYTVVDMFANACTSQMSVKVAAAAAARQAARYYRS